MTAISVALGTFIVSFVGICFGIFLRTNLPSRYLGDKTADTVKLCAGIIATLAALTLGLLIVSAKSSYDARIVQLRQIASNLILTDRLLTLYGGEEAREARVKLRASVPPAVEQIWTENTEGARSSYHTAEGADDFVGAIDALKPQNESQRVLRERIVQSTFELARSRLALFVQRDALLPAPLLMVLAFWFAVLFAAYSMYADINAVSVIALTICAASVTGAMFILFQMNNPFSGLVGIPRIDFVALMPPL